VIYAHTPSAPLPAFGTFPSAQMVRMMEGVITSGTGTRAALGRPAAGKTGTSQSYRDAWFVGFTPDWIAGVWVGNDDNRPMAGVTGGQLPADIWRRFMVLAHRGLPPSQFAWAPPLPDPPQPHWSPSLEPQPVDIYDEPWSEEGPEPARIWTHEDEDPVEAWPYRRADADVEPPGRPYLTWPSRSPN
jgi:penicillin-binding protein 1A